MEFPIRVWNIVLWSSGPFFNCIFKFFTIVMILVALRIYDIVFLIHVCHLELHDLTDLAHKYEVAAVLSQFEMNVFSSVLEQQFSHLLASRAALVDKVHVREGHEWNRFALAIDLSDNCYVFLPQHLLS